MTKYVSFAGFSKVFTVLGLVALLVYGIVLAGQSVVIMPTSEFNQNFYPSLEAQADVEHALKDQSR